ncbi:MAG: Uma2 family endonuclease [Planctomycetota bacterium]
MSTIARLTLADYDRMIEAGVFDQGRRRRLEFIRGEIREMNPIGSMHEVIVDRLAEWSFENVPKGRVWVRVQNSIGLPSLESAPEPDLAWAARRDYSGGRPTAEDVLLVIEVAETSLAYDTGEKADLYAAAGVADYWVVDVSARAIEVVPEVALRPSTLWESG